jgi:hypothetical protein
LNKLTVIGIVMFASINIANAADDLRIFEKIK